MKLYRLMININKRNNLIWIEDPIWYDWIAYYEDKKGNRYSRNGNRIERYEMCKHGFIFETIIKTDWPGAYEYHYEVTDARPDTIWQHGKWNLVNYKLLKWNRTLYNKLH